MPLPVALMGLIAPFIPRRAAAQSARSAPSAPQTGQSAFTESGAQGWVQVQVAGGTWSPWGAAAQLARSAPSAPQTGQSPFLFSSPHCSVQVQAEPAGGGVFPSSPPESAAGALPAQSARSAPSAPQTGQSSFLFSSAHCSVQVQAEPAGGGVFPSSPPEGAAGALPAQLARSAPSAPQTGQAWFTASGVQGALHRHSAGDALFVPAAIAGPSPVSTANAAEGTIPAAMASIRRKHTIRLFVSMFFTFQEQCARFVVLTNKWVRFLFS